MIRMKALAEAVRLSLPVDKARQTMTDKQDLCSGDRTVGIAALMQLADSYETADKILAYAMGLLDRFLAVPVIEPTADIKQVAVACFMLASKFVGASLMWIADMLRVVDLHCTTAAIELIEATLLQSINWSLHHTTGSRIFFSISIVRYNVSSHFMQHLTGLVAAFEIADDLVRCTDFESLGVLPLREHADFLMLLAHSRADMLHHSSHAIAAAALLTSIRLQAGAAAASAAAKRLPPAIGADAANACAAAMWAIRTPAASEAKPKPAAPQSKAGRVTGHVPVVRFIREQHALPQ